MPLPRVGIKVPLPRTGSGTIRHLSAKLPYVTMVTRQQKFDGEIFDDMVAVACNIGFRMEDGCMIDAAVI